MNFPLTNLSTFHSDILRQTHLGQLCGQDRLFRDRYQILRILGRGGFGVTFLATDVYLPGEPECVIKQLCPKTSHPLHLQTARVRFEREAKTLAKLGSHSQIPSLLDYFVMDGEFYLVQEYVQGATLARLVRRKGSLDETAVRHFLSQMLHLLQYIHNCKVIHRDIKPHNIIRCQDDGRLVLIDFGAVKEKIAQLGDIGLGNSTTNFVGTVGFAPPEQFALRPVYASDIYALGVTCVYLLTGKAPLDLECDPTTGELLWLDEVQVSDSFARILDKTIKISLQDRYRSAEAVLQDLNTPFESSQPTLARCLAVQPPIESSSNSSSEEYIPPTVRTAIAIREWKARLEAKHSQ